MRRTVVLVLALALVVPVAALAQDFDAVEIQTVQVSDTIYMLVGQGGNVGVSVGEDGVFHYRRPVCLR